jgi:hypothetical protein
MTAQEVRGGHYIENGTRTSLFFQVHLPRHIHMLITEENSIAKSKRGATPTELSEAYFL